MKKIYSSALAMLLLVSVFTQERVVRGQIFEESHPRVAQKFIPGEFLVRFKPNVSEQTIDALNSSHGVSTIYMSTYAGFRKLRIPGGETVADMVEIYRANGNVEYAEANYIAYALNTPNDELYSRQWHLYNTSYGGINVESAWTISTGSGVIVAILDMGIAYEDYSEKNPEGSNINYQQAPDLADTFFVAGYDFINYDEHPNDDSVSGHGTHIAGIVAQNTHNDIGTSGVAFNAYLMPVKVLDKYGAGTYASIAEGIIWATDNGAHVINLGLGGSEPSIALEEAIAYSYNRGVTIIAAAGNDGRGGVCYPAAYDDYVIAVGATRYDETLAYYSNYGLSLDLVAPGGDLNVDQNGDEYEDGILQQTYKIDVDSTISWDYSFMEGTSMAAAHVSGIAALLIANGNATSPAEVMQALESTAEDKGTAGWDRRYGWGVVDAFAALQWTASEPGPALGSQSLKAEFIAEPTKGLRNTTVQFTNQSTGNITSWLWDFGDGATSIDSNPSHLYRDARTYTVSLTVTGPDGSDTETKSSFIKLFIPKIPVADFTREPINISKPMTVQFTDSSTCPATLIEQFDGTIYITSIESASYGGITTWTWNFGDGTTSSERNATHTYRNIGSYTVSLSVAGPGGSDTEMKEDYIQVTMYSAPIANFTAKPRNGGDPLVVQFTDTSTGRVSSRLWNFGDGKTSTEQNPNHTYQNTGTYKVTLAVVGQGGSDTKTRVGYIQVTPSAPVANFTAKPRSGNDPLVVQLTDTSTGDVNNRLWDFGDGTTSNEQNPAHTYQNTGSYTVSLTVVGPGGSDTETKRSYIQVTHSPPIANFAATPRSGDGPLVVQFTDTSTGHVFSRLWDFGDGTTSTEQNPNHTYTFKDTGDFTVSLSATGLGGTDTETKTKYIHLNTPPIHVNIGLSKRAVFRSWHEVTASLTVTQIGPTGLPIAGATVEGTWSGSYGGTVSGITNASGGISFRTEWIGQRTTVTFTVNKVIIGSKEHDFTGTTTASIRI